MRRPSILRIAGESLLRLGVGICLVALVLGMPIPLHAEGLPAMGAGYSAARSAVSDECCTRFGGSIQDEHASCAVSGACSHCALVPVLVELAATAETDPDYDLAAHRVGADQLAPEHPPKAPIP